MRSEFEAAYWKAALGSRMKSKVPVIPYLPAQLRLPKRVLPMYSAWRGIESVLSDIIERFQIGTNRCLEFGVEFGYSTAALSSYFNSLVGVDIFVGDRHTGVLKDIYKETSERLSEFDNIRLVRGDYRDWIRDDVNHYDLIHVDIIHTFADTYACGLWSAQHAKCVIFHDTESFPAVRLAVSEIARTTGKKFYNFRDCNGLGILV